jgi:cytochrome P450
MTHLDALLDVTEDKELQNELLAARTRMLDDHKAPRNIRTIELLRLLHGLNMPHVLAFWMLAHIVSDSELLDRVRAETSQIVKVAQDAPVMGFTVPPRVTIDVVGLLGSKAPLLKRCWLETARVYSRGQGSWTATEEFDLQGQDGGIFKAAEKWKINKNDWVDAPYWHANVDGAVWDEPPKWDPQRHHDEEGKDMIFDTMVFDTRTCNSL